MGQHNSNHRQGLARDLVRMASDAEIRMLMMMNTMDLQQEGPMSSEDRLFMGSQQGARSQQPSQINPFGGVRWEGGRPVYDPSTYQTQPPDTHLFTPQQQQQQSCSSPEAQLLQQQQMQQQLQMQQQEQLLLQQQQLAQMQQQQSQQPQL